jgi:hypothetical protein
VRQQKERDREIDEETTSSVASDTSHHTAALNQDLEDVDIETGFPHNSSQDSLIGATGVDWTQGFPHGPSQDSLQGVPLDTSQALSPSSSVDIIGESLALAMMQGTGSDSLTAVTSQPTTSSLSVGTSLSSPSFSHVLQNPPPARSSELMDMTSNFTPLKRTGTVIPPGGSKQLKIS